METIIKLKEWLKGRKTYGLYLIGFIAFGGFSVGWIDEETFKAILGALGLSLPLTIYAAVRRNK